MIVLTFLLRRLPGLSADEFHRYWRDEHGPLVASHASALGVRRYAQLHATDSPIGAAVAESRGCAEPEWDGEAVLWFDSEAALLEAAATEAGLAAGAALLEDERRFLDLPRCELFLNGDGFNIPRSGKRGRRIHFDLHTGLKQDYKQENDILTSLFLKLLDHLHAYSCRNASTGSRLAARLAG